MLCNDLVGLENKKTHDEFYSFRIPGSRHVVITGADRQAIHKQPGTHTTARLIALANSRNFFSVPDPGSGAFLTPGSGIRNGKNSDPG